MHIELSFISKGNLRNMGERESETETESETEWERKVEII